MPFPFLMLLGMSAVAVVLGGCAGIDLTTPEGQCKAARIGETIVMSEGLDGDTVRRADLASDLACPAAD